MRVWSEQVFLKVCLTPPAITWAVGPINLIINSIRQAAVLRTSNTSAPHLVLLVLSTFNTDGHRNVPWASAPIVVQASPVVSGRGSGILLPRHPSGCRSGLAPPCLLPFRLRARARSCWNQLEYDPPSTPVQGFRAYPRRTLP